MKRYIVIGFSLFAFILISGCAKSEEDKCKDKGWFWYESTQECKETAPQREEGEVPVSAAETEEACKAKARHMWDAQNSQCKKLNYFMLIRSKNSDLHNVYVALKKEGHSDEEVYLEEDDECAEVPEAYLSHLVVEVKTRVYNITWDEVCSNLAGSEKKCELGVYEIKLVDGNVNLQAVTPGVDRTDCQLLKIAN